MMLIYLLSILGHGSSLIEIPDGCLRTKELPCAVRNSGNAMALSEYGLLLSKGSSIVFLAPAMASPKPVTARAPSVATFSILDGAVLVNQPKNSLRLKGTDFLVELSGVWLVDVTKQPDGWGLTNINGSIVPIESVGIFEIPKGFANWFSTLDRSGQRLQGVPSGLTYEVARKILRRRISKTLDFETELAWLKSQNGRQIAQAAELFQEIVQKRQEDIERKNQLERRRTMLKEKEKAELRQHFRQRFLEP